METPETQARHKTWPASLADDSRISQDGQAPPQSQDESTLSVLAELAAPPPVQNPSEELVYRRAGNLEEAQERTREDQLQRRRQRRQRRPGRAFFVAPSSAVVTARVHTVSYLVLFSILGTLARLGLQALTVFPGTPAAGFASIWPNFAGCVVMGFLMEDRLLFRLQTRGPPLLPRREGEGEGEREREGEREGEREREREREREQEREQEQERMADNNGPNSGPSHPKPAAGNEAATHLAAKKALPAYIGLTTGFCGSLTSFSAFMRDVFLALSNDLPVVAGASVPPASRSPGRSFMAMVSVLITTVALSLSGLVLGGHLALATHPFAERLPRPSWRLGRLHHLSLPLAVCTWTAAVVLSVLGVSGSWAGRRVCVALALAPPGCVLRFALSLAFNARAASFPLGTFASNMLGTAVLGAAWDGAHAGGGVSPTTTTTCLVLVAGVQDGFCGCLTTVSTWVAELAGLRRRHGWAYGAASVATGLAILVAVMGGLRWTVGFGTLTC